MSWTRWKLETTLGKNHKLSFRTTWLVWKLINGWSAPKAANSSTLLADMIATKNMTLKDKSRMLQEPSVSKGANMSWERTTNKDHCDTIGGRGGNKLNKKLLSWILAW